MSPLALVLLLAAGLAHATWNLLAKRSGGSVAFVWLFGATSTVVLFVPAVVILIIERPTLGVAQLVFIIGSGLFHIAYFLLLQRGYRVGDLSLVYPTARGTGVLLATAGGVLLLHEHPGVIALLGALAVILAVGATGGNPRRLLSSRTGLGYPLVTGVAIATYTLWDKHAVDALAIPPLVYYWGFNLVMVIGILPLALRAPGGIRPVWRSNRREILGVGVLSPTAYILVLSALVFTPVSYVAPAREIGIVFGTAMGVFLLREGDARRRLLCAAVILVGVALLALG